MQIGRYGAMTHTVTNNFHTLRELRSSLLDPVQFHPPSLLCCAGTVWVVLEHHSWAHSEPVRAPIELALSPSMRTDLLFNCLADGDTVRARVREEIDPAENVPNYWPSLRTCTSPRRRPAPGRRLV